MINFFQPFLPKKNSKGVPAIGVAISSVLVSFFMMMNYTKGLVDQFKFLILLTTLTVLIPYLFSTAAYIIFRLKEANLSKWIKYSAISLASLAFLFFMWMIIGSGQEIVYWGFVLSMSSIPVYVWGVTKRNKKNKL